MSDIQEAIKSLKLCEHGNYHCMFCEVKMLKLVITEQAEEIKQKDADIKIYESMSQEYEEKLSRQNEEICRLQDALSEQLGEEDGAA